MAPKRVPTVLSIAGSDSGGGAGIQADLKAIARCGAHGMTAVTAVTAQNTVGVTGVYPLPPEAIVEQVRAVADDIGVDAVKIGMLGTAETIGAVGRALDLVAAAPVVLDPVMVAESGARLLDEAPSTRCARHPAAGGRGHSEPARGDDPGGRRDTDAEELARAIHALGPGAVVVTGGHRETARTCSSTATRWSRSRVSGIPTARPTARAAPTRRRLPPRSHTAPTPLEAARRAKLVAAEAVRDGLRGLGAGRARSTCSDSARR